MMQCSCAQWEEILGFVTPGEYHHFIQWIEAQRTAGRVKETAVIGREPFSTSPPERHFICVGCGGHWRLIAPDPPGLGAFERAHRV